MEQDILKELLEIINIKNIDTLDNYTFERDILLDKDVIESYYKLIPKLKKKYSSNILTCLHLNSIKKQKFPAINMLRQILKCNGYHMIPLVKCLGYCDKVKLTKRYFTIYKLTEDVLASNC